MRPEEASRPMLTSWWCSTSCSRGSRQSFLSCRRYRSLINDMKNEIETQNSWHKGVISFDWNEFNSTLWCCFRSSMGRLFPSGWLTAGMLSFAMTLRIWWVQWNINLEQCGIIGQYQNVVKMLILSYQNRVGTKSVFCLHSAGFSPSCSRTQSQWESCGWACCAFTQKSLTSKNTSSASVKGNASPPLRNSGPVNASRLKVLTQICSSLCFCQLLYISVRLIFYSLFCLFSSDPFDLNHNLGAGVSRKSKWLGPGIKFKSESFFSSRITS